jgi:hypothetical protein
MDEGTGILPGLPPVAGTPVHVMYTGGLMTSDAGVFGRSVGAKEPPTLTAKYSFDRRA